MVTRNQIMSEPKICITPLELIRIYSEFNRIYVFYRRDPEMLQNYCKTVHKTGNLKKTAPELYQNLLFWYQLEQKLFTMHEILFMSLKKIDY